MRRFLVIVVALLALSCGRVGSTLFVDMHSVDLHCWSKPVTILYQNSDTLSLRDIAVALRYNDNFEGDTLSVVIQTSLPDVHQFREKVVLRLKREYTASAVTSSESVPYRSSSLLGEDGYYMFTITPCRAVEGVEAVGIEISDNGKR